MADFSNDIDHCLDVLKRGGLILYPTDTIWGIGCDATNQSAVQKIFTLKKREDYKTMIILISEKIDISNYVTHPDAQIFAYVSQTIQPVTAIYKNGKNVATGLISEDGTIAVRITSDEFCAALIQKFNKPIVSTSANVSGKPAPANFNDIEDEIKNGVDFIVQHRRISDFKAAKPSAIIKLDEKGKIKFLRY